MKFVRSSSKTAHCASAGLMRLGPPGMSLPGPGYAYVITPSKKPGTDLEIPSNAADFQSERPLRRFVLNLILCELSCSSTPPPGTSPQSSRRQRPPSTQRQHLETGATRAGGQRGHARCAPRVVVTERAERADVYVCSSARRDERVRDARDRVKTEDESKE